MSASQLAETASILIRDHIKANIAAALAELRTDRADAKVTTEPPQNYFFFENARSYRTPAVFIICQEMDFRKQEQAANHVSARSTFNVSVVVEDRAEDYLTTKAWRYQAALYKVLEQQQLEDSSESVKLVVSVRRATFSPTFTTAGQTPDTFRKEVLLECDVYHFENF